MTTGNETVSLGARFANFRSRCTNKIVLCDLCHRPIVTKATNQWAAHWGCVVYGKKFRQELSDTQGRGDL